MDSSTRLPGNVPAIPQVLWPLFVYTLSFSLGSQFEKQKTNSADKLLHYSTRLSHNFLYCFIGVFILKPPLVLKI